MTIDSKGVTNTSYQWHLRDLKGDCGFDKVKEIHYESRDRAANGIDMGRIKIED
jgi:hypothetical protein